MAGPGERLKTQRLLRTAGLVNSFRNRPSLLKMHHDQVAAALHAKLSQQVRHMEFDGAFGDIELIRDLLIGEVIQQTSQNLSLTLGHVCRGRQ